MPNRNQPAQLQGIRWSPLCAKLLLFAFITIPTLFVPRDLSAAVTPVITSAKSVSVTAGSTFFYQMSAMNAPVSYGARGLPAGLAINTTTGVISGKAAAVATSTVTLTAANGAGTGVATLTLSIVPKSDFVQSVSNATSGTARSASLSFSNNTLAGDVILFGFDYDKIAAPLSVTDSQGNSFTRVGSQLTSPGGSGSVVYLAKNIKGGTDTITVTLTTNSGWLELYLSEYSGVNQTNPIDVQSGASGNAGSVTSGKSTTTFAGDIIYGFCVGDWSCTAGSGFTAWSTLNDNLLESKIAGNPGAYVATGSANNGWTMQMVALKPAAPVSAPEVSLSPGNLTFSSQVVGTTGAAQTIAVKNSGTAVLSITGIAVTGTNGTDFTQTSTCGISVGAGTSCTIGVAFKPIATGNRTAAVTLSDNAASGPQSVALSGAGVSVGSFSSAATSLSTSSLNFGNEPVGMISSSQVITLTNTGSAPLNIASIALTGSSATDFIQVNTCGISVAAGGKCTIAVLFTPSAIGARGSTLAVTDNGVGSPHLVSISGNGAHDVILNWTASPSSGVMGYNIYRGSNSGGENSTPLNPVPINGISFTDANVTAGAVFYYVVTAVASNGVTQSAASSQISATVP